MAKPFKGTINLDVRDSVADWDAFTADRPRGRAERARRALRRHGQAAWSPYGGRIEMPTLERLAANGLTYSQWHTTALCSPTRSTLPHRPQPPLQRLRLDLRVLHRLPRLQLAHPARERDARARAARRRLQHVLGRQEPQHAGRRLDAGLLEESGRSAWATTASTASSAARPTTGIRTSPRTTTTSTSPTCPRTATTCPRTSPTRRCASSATPSSPSPTSPGTCGSVPAPTMRRTMRRRSSSTSTRARSTTATRPTASGCCRA